MTTDQFPVLFFAMFVLLIDIFFLISFEVAVRLGRNLLEKGYALETEVKQRKLAQAAVEVSLNEKELLLKEIHHRVKNNLQIIASLLRMQARRVEDPQIGAILDDSRGRVQAISLIHETFYRPGDISRVSMPHYINELIEKLFDLNDIDPDLISVHTDIDPVHFNIETATPCGLIINELVTNCLKYAFSPSQHGDITISLKKNAEDGYRLIVSDNGKGLPTSFDPATASSLGLQLVYNLTIHQFLGTMEIKRGNGTTFIINFHEIEYKKRI